MIFAIAVIHINFSYKLLAITQLFSLSQVVNSRTHFNSNGNHTLIDLIFVSNKDQFSNCCVISPLANSDHCGPSLSLSWKVSQRQASVCPRRVWRYKMQTSQKLLA